MSLFKSETSGIMDNCAFTGLSVKRELGMRLNTAERVNPPLTRIIRHYSMNPWNKCTILRNAIGQLRPTGKTRIVPWCLRHSLRLHRSLVISIIGTDTLSIIFPHRYPQQRAKKRFPQLNWICCVPYMRSSITILSEQGYRNCSARSLLKNLVRYKICNRPRMIKTIVYI